MRLDAATFRTSEPVDHSLPVPSAPVATRPPDDRHYLCLSFTGPDQRKMDERPPRRTVGVRAALHAVGHSAGSGCDAASRLERTSALRHCGPQHVGYRLGVLSTGAGARHDVDDVISHDARIVFIYALRRMPRLLLFAVPLNLTMILSTRRKAVSISPMCLRVCCSVRFRSQRSNAACTCRRRAISGMSPSAPSIQGSRRSTRFPDAHGPAAPGSRGSRVD